MGLRPGAAQESRPPARFPEAGSGAGAIRALKFMKEQGVLLALRDVSGPAGELARAAYFELMNPKVVLDGVKVPENKKGE